MNPNRNDHLRRSIERNYHTSMTIDGGKPFLINIVDSFQYLRGLKSLSTVVDDLIPIHRCISTLESKEKSNMTKTILFFFVLRTSTSRSFCRRSSDRSDVDNES